MNITVRLSDIDEDPFGNAPKRPYLILSNGQEYIGVAITTTVRTEAIELTTDGFETGRPPRASCVSPRSVLTLKDWMITKQPPKATDPAVDNVRREMEAGLRAD